MGQRIPVRPSNLLIGPKLKNLQKIFNDISYFSVYIDISFFADLSRNLFSSALATI